MVVNDNGVVFTGSSQVNVRNLVAAAATISDGQFENGLYGAGNTATFRDAAGKVLVEQGAQIATHGSGPSTSGGGYVLLVGKDVENAGTVHTPRGQALLAAGDSFVIKKGQGTEGNQQSTTRGNEVAASGDGTVRNSGLIQSPQGDITLTANEVEVAQSGVLVSSTSVNNRGTIHLTATGDGGHIKLADQAVSAILVDASDGTAFDSQRDGLQAPVVDTSGEDVPIVPADAFRRDQSLVRITSSGTVDFQGGSLTLATGGQVSVDAAQRTLVRDGATIDVAGAVGVAVAMEANSVQINIQGNEQRDSPVNRDSNAESGGSYLNSSNVWVDVRDLVFVPAGTNGYATDRWYTKGGLLEVSGYLGTQAHSAGQWLAQGGTVSFTGNDVVTQAGSQINLSGGTLDVLDGYIRQSWLRGANGRLYEVSSAPGDVLYTGLYRGYELTSERWGHTRYYYNPLIAPGRRWESGYTVGRDAGTLVVGTKSAVLEGEIVSDTYQGSRQTQAAQAGLDGYYQSQRAVARRGQLVVGQYIPYYVKESGTLQYGLTANGSTIQNVVLADGVEQVASGIALDGVLPEDRQGTLYLDTEQINDFELGGLKIAAGNRITVDDALTVGHGGEITLYGPAVDVNADVSSHAGSIRLGNVLYQISGSARQEDTVLAGTAAVNVAEGVRIDASGLWSNLLLAPADITNLPYQNGGSVSIRTTGAISLADTSLVDVSSGAAVLPTQERHGGSGGDVVLEAAYSGGDHVLSLGASIRGFGVEGGGTLDLRAARVQIGLGDVVEDGTLVLNAGFFDKGFGDYRVTGRHGLTVADGAQVDVSMPVFRYRTGSVEAITSAGVEGALEVWAPPLVQEDPVAAVLTRRSGAALRLQTGNALSSFADRANVELKIGRGATVSVDPGQAIQIRSLGQLTVEGTLNAWGGRIELGTLDARVDPAGHGRSVWIGDGAVLDVAGRAATAIDATGKRYGFADKGGKIIIGGVFDQGEVATGRMNPETQSRNADDIFVVISKGALLDASGTSASVDLPTRRISTIASSGGAITLASSNGVYVEGRLLADAGGSGAAGGSLTMVLDGPHYKQADAVARVRSRRELAIVHGHDFYGPLAGTDPESAVALLEYGHGKIGVDQIAAGGFDRLTLASDGLLSFQDNVTLSVGHSLNLYAAMLGTQDGSGPSPQIQLAAPYVRLSGYVGGASPGGDFVHPPGGGGVSTQPAVGSMSVRAGELLDVGGNLYIGASDRRPFETLLLESVGDMRFLGGDFYTPGNLTLAAAQLYPVTGASAALYAGWRGANVDFDPGRVLTVARTTEEAPQTPYSVFGKLTLGASTINQGGVVRAPFGQVVLGTTGRRITSNVNLLNGSETSVSASGLVMPYGGTADGVTWTYGGSELSLVGTGSAQDARVELVGQRVDVNAGAVIDLSGGGELTGAGFVAGRGGSTDARFHPLVQISADSFRLPGLDTNPVYAIVPGAQAPAAPVGRENGVSDVLVGQQITIRSNDIPGLPAGTYTLLPSTYALLPGAYRVELNGAPSLAGLTGPNRAAALRNGSYAGSGVLSIAGTDIQQNLPSQVILTPADTLRRYSEYNETSYAQFARADAATLGVPRAVVEADGKNLWLRLLARGPENSESVSLQFEGEVLGEAAEGGRGSTASVIGSSGGSRIEILGDAGSPDPSYEISVRASDLSELGVSRLAVGGVPWVAYGQGGNLVRFGTSSVGVGGANVAPASGVVLRSGAILSASEVMLITLGHPSNPELGEIVVEQGASITTLRQGAPAYDSIEGFIYQPEEQSIVAVSNGRMQWLAPEATRNAAPGPIRIGTCTSLSCAGTTQLYSEGTIAFATSNDFELDDAVRFGTRHLSLAVGAFNVGTQPALADAAARGVLTPGLTLNQQVMELLLQGDTSLGAPPLETLELIAGQSMNFFDTVTLSTLGVDGKSLLDNLMLTTPAIYGYGDVADVALFRTGHLIWNGSVNQPGAIADAGAGTGSGRLQMEAEQITFGYGPWGQPDGVSELSRLAVGFADVNLQASQRVDANGAGKLSVYQSQGEYQSGEGYRYTGGNLNISTPLWTGEEGSVNAITAGGVITVTAPATGLANPAEVFTLGAELSLTAGGALSLDTAVALPSGRLTLVAEGDVTLGNAAHLDLAGRSVEFFQDEEATRYSWGGEAKLKSAGGSIYQAGGSVIDISAQYNQAGRFTAIALGDAAGTVDLQGRILGSASGYYEAGGTYVPYLAGSVLVQAQNLGGDLSEAFAALNERLNDGDVTGQRAFQFKQGDLTIADGLRANQIEVSLDGGHLTVAGTIDASGEQVGSIRLAGKEGLTVLGSAVLDAHGTLLRLDSYGKIIEAPNRAIVELHSGGGLLTLGEGARVDLRYGVDDARVAANPVLHDGRVLGTVELFAPRVDADGNANTEAAATHGDIAIDVRGTVDIEGAKSIAVNAVQRYDDAPVGTDAAAGGEPYQVVDQVYLDAKHADSTAFIGNALANDNLLDGKLAGLNRDTYRNVFHLRPGVEIVSATAEGGIVVSGDMDLSGYRYASLNPNLQKTTVYGSGEPGALAIRAGGDLSIYGSINDGFAPPPETPDDNGWVLTPGMQAYGGDVVVPGPGIELADGTRFPPGKVLNYDLPIQAVTLATGTELPVATALAAELLVPAGTVLGAAIRDADGNVLYAAGTVLRESVTLTAGARLDAGFRLPGAASLAAMVWPAGVPLPSRASSNPNTDPDGVFLAGRLEMLIGAVIPSMTDVKLVGDVPSVPLRSVTGASMGRNWAVASMLPEGSQSWGLRLVAGADIDAADPRLTQPDAKGSLILADTHYSLYEQRERVVIPGTPPQPGGAWYWTDEGADTWGLEAGTPVAPEWQSICDIPGQCIRVEYVWSDEGADTWGMEAGAPVAPEWQSICDIPGQCISLGDPIPGTPDQVVVGEVTRIIPLAQNFSVLRTGTGDLELIAAGDVAMQSLYGVYTAGTSTGSRAGQQAGAFDRARGKQADGTYLGTSFIPELPEGMDPPGPLYESLVNGEGDSTYGAWYPDNGGNLLLRVGGNLVGDVAATYAPRFANEDLRPQRSSADAGNWLWRQSSGGTSGVGSIDTSWWINFGTYVPGSAVGNGNYGLSTAERNAVLATPELVGFTGLGTLGGGNLSIRVDGDAGLINRRGSTSAITGGRQRSEGLIVAVGSSGRMLDSGELLLTGGGDLRMDISGGLNPGLSARADRSSVTGSSAVTAYNSQNLDLNGVLANLRGSVQLSTREIGGVALTYFNTIGTQVDARESRSYDPYASSLGTATGGPVVMLGDAAATLSARGDLVVSGAGDLGRVALPYSLPYVVDGDARESGGQAWFSLWTENTGIRLFSAGGNIGPSVQLREVASTNLSAVLGKNYSATDGRFIWPGQLDVTAAGGSVFLGKSALGISSVFNAAYSLVLAPFDNSRLEIVAGDSIYAGGYVVSRSAAPIGVMPTPFSPAFAAFNPLNNTLTAVHNLAGDAIWPEAHRLPLFAFGPNSIAGASGNSNEPARIYAKDGDIIGFGTGEILTFVSGARTGQTWYEGAGPVWMRAGQDIVRSGQLLASSVAAPSEIGRTPSNLTSISSVSSYGNIVVHSDSADTSIVQAGRDILFSNFNVAGPGTLEISAGRNIVMAGQVEGGAYGETRIRSLGPVAAGDSRPGASIAIHAGVGKVGASYSAFLDLYLNSDNLADADEPLAGQPGKVVKTYENELLEWLSDRYGFEGTVDEALGYFALLGAEQQRIFGRQVYFQELRAGGREYNDTDGPRFGSYLRGRNAIAALFPEKDAAGEAIVYQGDLLMYGGAGAHTEVGGDIHVLTPGGGQTYGIEGDPPPPTAGLITRGQGNIQLYSLGSILLGQSRIMTTFGGDILAWSAEGDINAGRGSKTTVVYTPPRRVYDAFGNVTLSPEVPSTGAGIATDAPIPEVPPGDLDLIAPLGTIDAGEAGIRFSGNANFAALQVVNAANIVGQGEMTGIPVVAAVNVGALTNASSASAAAATSAQDAVARSRAAARQNLPSIISVQILGFGDGGEPAAPAPARIPAIPGRENPAPVSYDRNSSIQLLEKSAVGMPGSTPLTDRERANLL